MPRTVNGRPSRDLILSSNELQYPRPARHGAVARVDLPEVDVALAAGHDAPVLGGVELCRHHRLGGHLR